MFRKLNDKIFYKKLIRCTMKGYMRPFVGFYSIYSTLSIFFKIVIIRKMS